MVTMVQLLAVQVYWLVLFLVVLVKQRQAPLVQPLALQKVY